MVHFLVTKLSTEADADHTWSSWDGGKKLSVVIYCTWLQRGCFPLTVVFSHVYCKLLADSQCWWATATIGTVRKQRDMVRDKRYIFLNLLIMQDAIFPPQNESWEAKHYYVCCLSFSFLLSLFGSREKNRWYLKQSVTFTTEMWVCASKHTFKGVQLYLRLCNFNLLSKEDFKCFQSRSAFLA